MSDERGQMTVELAVAFPVLIAVAVIAVNALLFLSECAAFDDAFREAVRVHATSPGYGEDLDDGVAAVQEALEASFDADYLAVSVTVEGTSAGYVTFTGTLSFTPTLFGKGTVDSVFGVQLPALSHSVRHTVDRYKPGAVV